jgi:curved DNA-binding protein
VDVRIPPGAEDGERLRVRAAGAPGRGGAPPGDLLVQVRVRPHARFRREGLDLHLRLPLTVAEAWNGAEVDVPTPHGTARLHVPRRSQPGERLRLRGQGVERAGRRGDCIVELEVRLPDRDDPAMDELARRAATAYARPVREGLSL